MERNLVKQIHAEIDAAVAIVLKKHNLTKISSGITYNESNFDIRIKTVLINNDLVKKAGTLTKVDAPKHEEWGLKAGFAKPGTICHTFDNREVRILSSRRTKYSFEFTAQPGKLFVAKYSCFK